MLCGMWCVCSSSHVSGPAGNDDQGACDLEQGQEPRVFQASLRLQEGDVWVASHDWR